MIRCDQFLMIGTIDSIRPLSHRRTVQIRLSVVFVDLNGHPMHLYGASGVSGDMSADIPSDPSNLDGWKPYLPSVDWMGLDENGPTVRSHPIPP